MIETQVVVDKQEAKIKIPSWKYNTTVIACKTRIFSIMSQVLFTYIINF
jgi:hypothetical protein